MLHVTFFLGKYDKPPTLKVSPWPFIPAGNHFKVNMTFTPGKLKLTWRCFNIFYGFSIKSDIVTEAEGGAHEIQRLNDHRTD